MSSILIIGGGAAGLSAAATAAEAGLSVTVLEKRKYTGGNGQYAEGVFGAGSRLQKRNNINADPEKLFRQAMEYAHWRSDARLTRTLIDASGETVDWLCDIGVPFSRVLHHMPNQSPEVFHMAYPSPTGTRVMSTLKERCAKLGVTIHTEAAVTGLLLSEGSVVGASTVIGGQQTAFAADCVLIATGGFAGNHELMRQMIPGCNPENYMHLKGIPMDGDGLQMAKEAGASICRDIAIEGCAPVFRGRREITPLIRRADALWVNAFGQRFCDETICDDFIHGQNAVARQPGKMCWAILDEATVRRAFEALPGLMADPSETKNGMEELYEALEKELENGRIFKASTIQKLAVAAGIDTDTLLDETTLYNADCARGYDSLFGKDRRFMQPLTEGPYYAIPAGIDIITTHGGIQTDCRMRVLAPDGTPVPGLFAAGIDISGVDSADYSVMLSGHAFGFSLAGGRLAAMEMARQLGAGQKNSFLRGIFTR